MSAEADGAASPSPAFASLVDVLRHRAAVQPDARAIVVLADRGGEEAAITFRELECRAAALAGRIAAVAASGDRALLLCPHGIDFAVGFFACLMAGVIAVPLMPPRRRGDRDASAAIVADCTPRLALAPGALIAGERGDFVGRFAVANLAWIAVDDASSEGAATALPAPGGGDVALLQYTSGSTSTPKGVMVTHANLLANLAMIEAAFGNTRQSTCVSWVPLYHDMGLIINLLQSLYIGALCVLMSPVAFIQRPHLWLRAISDYRAEVAAAPNFAYDLCVERYRPEHLAGIDLAGWRLALNGAEPVRAETIRRFADTFARHGFAANAAYPAYGLAEATVLVAAGRRGTGATVRQLSRTGLLRHRVAAPADLGDAQEAVGCGRALGGERLAIVDPDTRQRLGPDRICEVWVSGPNVAAGYWRNPEATAAAFAARIAGEEDAGAWLRTGDLGFLDDSGELFITGRRKEIVIVRGANNYPQDIEETVQRCDPALRRHGGAAFAVVDGSGAEQLVVVQEVERTQRHHIAPADLVGRIREAIVAEHDIAPYDIALLRPGALPKTTSGKIQRALSRELWRAGALERL